MSSTWPNIKSEVWTILAVVATAHRQRVISVTGSKAKKAIIPLGSLVSIRPLG